MSFDEWTPSPPQPPQPPIDGLPPANAWNPAPGCSVPPTSPAIAAGVIITGRPALISAMPWQITLNDGGGPPNFTIDHYDASGNLIDHPLEFSGVDGSATFNDPVNMPAATAASLTITSGNLTVPSVNQFVIPGGPIGAYLGSAHPSGALAWFNLPPPPIPNDAPTDGQLYGRENGAWTAISVGTGFLPLTGGTMTGGIFFNVTNVAVVNRFVAGQTAGAMRWALMLGDNATESGSNVGSNFTIQSFADNGSPLAFPFSINRQNGQTILTNSGGNTPSLAISKPTGGVSSLAGAAGASLRWQMYLGDFNAELGGNAGSNFRLTRYSDAGAALSDVMFGNRATGQITFNYMPSFPGGSAGQFLSTDGAGGLSWGTVTIPPPVIPTDAPTDGQQYARQSVPSGSAPQWAPVVAGPSYVLPPATTTTLGGVKVDGTSIQATADGTISTVLVPMGDNRIINGDMRINQRGASSGTAQGYTVDRWQYSSSQANLLIWGQTSNNAAGQAASGFGYYLSITSQSAYTPVATDYTQFTQAIEADFIADFAFGTPSAKLITLSFWAVSSLTGTFGGCVSNGTGNRSYPFVYSIPVANVWTRIVVTIPGDTAGTWVLQGNAAGLTVHFDLGSGANYRGPAGTWIAGGLAGANGAVNVIATNGASWGVTGVKLEIGNVATPFNRQSLTKSLADCQRYYSNTLLLWFTAYAAGDANIGQTVTFPASMRAPPSVTFNNPSYSNTTAIGIANGPNLSSVGLYAIATTTGMVNFAADNVVLNAEL